MEHSWTTSLIIILALTGPSWSDSIKPNETLSTETTTEPYSDEELLPEAAPLTGDQEWFDSQKTNGDEDMMEDDGTEDEVDDIETAGSELVSTVVKQDENGKGEAGEEGGMRRRRKKGRKRRRRMRKRPRTTTQPPAAEASEAYATSAPIEAEENSEKAPVQIPQEEVGNTNDGEGDQAAYPRRRPGRRRKRPWKRPSTEANQQEENPENRNPEIEAPPLPEIPLEEPSSPPPPPPPSANPRRRKRPKNRNRVPQEISESKPSQNDAEENLQKGELKHTEKPSLIPDNHKEYRSTTQENRQRDEFSPTIKPKIKNEEDFSPTVKPRLQSNEDKYSKTPSLQNDLAENNLQTHAEQINQDGHRFHENEHFDSSGKQIHQEQKQTSNKPAILPTEYPRKEQKPKDYQSFGPHTEQKTKDYQSFDPQTEQKPREYQSFNPQIDQKLRDHQPFSPQTEQKPNNYQSFGQQTPQKPKEYQQVGSQIGQKQKDYQSFNPQTEQKQKEYQSFNPQTEQKQKDYQSFNPQTEQRPRDYQSFGPQTNRPNLNKQLFQPQNVKFAEPTYSNNEQNKQTGTLLNLNLPTNIPFRTNEYDGFQQFQKHYGHDPHANNTQLNRLKNMEQTRGIGPETLLRPTTSTSLRNQNENTENRQQTNNLPKLAPQNTNTNSFLNYSQPNRPSDINSYGTYSPAYGYPTKPTLSTPQNPREIKSDPERPNHFPIYHKQQAVNIPQSGTHHNKQKTNTKEIDTLSTTYRPPIPIGFASKPQNDNSLLQSRPGENNRQQYAKPQNNEYQSNLNPQENNHAPQRNKANQQQPLNINNEDLHKGQKTENPFINRFPSIPQQNILRQISSQNHQFPAQASVIVSDSIETNSAKPQFSYIHDFSGKFKPAQTIDQFNKQLIDPTLLTSPVLFDPPVPPLFEEELPSTKLTPTKVHLPPITHPKSKSPPAPFLPPSQKQLPNTQFQRQAEPAPFKLPLNEQQLVQKVIPPQSTQSNNQSKRNNLPQTSASIPDQKEKELEEEIEQQNDEIKAPLPTRNVIQQTTTLEPETTSNYIEPQTTKAAGSDRVTRKPLFTHAKRLPPTSAVIRRKVRPHSFNNTTTTENTPITTTTTTSNDNRENLSEKYKGKSNRNKNLYRQHLTEIEPTQKPAKIELDPYKKDNLDQNIFPDPQYTIPLEDEEKPLSNINDQEPSKVRRPTEKQRTTTSYSEIVTESTSAKPGRFGLHHVSAQQEILRQTLQKQKDIIQTEDSTDPPFIPSNPPDEESEFADDFVHESKPAPVFTSSKKTHSFTTQKHSNRQRTHGRDSVIVTTSTTPKYTPLEVLTDKPEYTTSDEYEFMVSDEELEKMMKPMMGDDEDKRDSEDLKFKAANIHGVKDEILDLIKTDSGSARLSKILKLRNMSLDDLIKHRERGSSQLHLSEIFPHKKQHILEPTNPPEPTAIYAVPNYSNSQDDVEAEITPIFESNYIKHKGESDRVRNATVTSETKTQKNNNYFRDGPSGQSEEDKNNNREPKVFESMPSFTLRTDILEKINEKKENGQKTDSSWRFFGQINKPERPLRPSFEDVVISYTSTNRYPYRKPTVEEIDDIILLSDTEQYEAPRSNVIHAKVLADSGERKDQEFFTETKKLSSGVKSAIIVSAAIIGIAVLGFFALMISCRIKQKKARLRAQRDILCDHFHEELRSSARSTSPVIPHGPEENTCEHGVRSTAIPTQHYNNRHYYLWRTLRKTFQYE